MSHAPYKPPEYELADITALKALQAGNADKDMQQRALKYIIENLCGTYDLSYHPGNDGRRDTDMAEGKRFVGLQIVKMLTLNTSELRSKQ